MSTRARTGDKVNFSARGRILSGVVIRERVKRRRGKARALAAMVTGDESSLDHVVFEIDTTEGVWTVGDSSILKVLGRADSDTLTNAAQHKSDIVNARRVAIAKRRAESHDVATCKGLDVLRDGDAVQIQYRGGYWRTHTFRGFTASGNVRFETNDLMGERVRTVSPSFARVVS